MSNNRLVLISVLLLIIPAVFADGECSSDPIDHHKSQQALRYKIAALVSILIASSIGVSLPFLGSIIPSLHPDRNLFFLIKAFAAGVILATGFIHVLPDAFENLTSPCLNDHPWAEFPFTGFIAMVSSIGTLMIDSFANSYYSKLEASKENNNNHNNDEEKDANAAAANNHVHAHGHGHSHGGSAAPLDSPSQLIRHRVISQVGDFLISNLLYHQLTCIYTTR